MLRTSFLCPRNGVNIILNNFFIKHQHVFHQKHVGNQYKNLIKFRIKEYCISLSIILYKSLNI